MKHMKRLRAAPTVSATLTAAARCRALYHCNYCDKDISASVRIKCAVCADFDLCLECFRCVHLLTSWTLSTAGHSRPSVELCRCMPHLSALHADAHRPWLGYMSWYPLDCLTEPAWSWLQTVCEPSTQSGTASPALCLQRGRGDHAAQAGPRIPRCG